MKAEKSLPAHICYSLWKTKLLSVYECLVKTRGAVSYKIRSYASGQELIRAFKVERVLNTVYKALLKTYTATICIYFNFLACSRIPGHLAQLLVLFKLGLSNNSVWPFSV